MTDRIIQKSFEYFFRKAHNQDKYQFHYTPHTLKIYESFLSEIEKRVRVAALGKHFIWRYSIFQFAYWQDIVLDTPSSKVGFSHIYGKKAVERYFTRNKEYDWQLEEHFILSKYKLSYLQFEEYTGIVKDKLDYTNSPIRLRFLNTDKGLATCISQTSLFERRDKSCLSCNFQQECQTLLKTNYPNIYKNRYGSRTI